MGGDVDYIPLSALVSGSTSVTTGSEQRFAAKSKMVTPRGGGVVRFASVLSERAGSCPLRLGVEDWQLAILRASSRVSGLAASRGWSLPVRSFTMKQASSRRPSTVVGSVGLPSSAPILLGCILRDFP